MKDELLLFNAMTHLAIAYDPMDVYEWQRRCSYGKMADDIAKELKDMGYCLQKIKHPLAGETTESTDEVTLTNEEGE